MQRVGILGAGLAGLTVAFRRAAAGDHVTLVEEAVRLGGQLWTERDAGFVVEHGAEGFVAGSLAVPALADALGGLTCAPQETFRSYGYDGGALVELAKGQAATFLGFQVPRGELGAGIRTFRGGMGQLADALAAAIMGRVDIRLGLPATGLARTGKTWRLLLAHGAVEELDRVVVALPSAAAATVLEPQFGDPARALRSAPTSSSVTVSLAYDRSAIEHPLDGTGFVIAGQATGLRACTFVTSKFADRAPESMVVLRLFFRPSEAERAHPPRVWQKTAEDAVVRILGARQAPRRVWTSEWFNALPIFTPEHRDGVRALEAELAGTGVRLAGSAFHGAGIDAAVRSAEAAAREE